MKLLTTRYSLNFQCGITLYLAMLVMGGAVAVALSVSTVFIGEFKITSDAVNSLKAVYVADSAMEYALYQARPNGDYTYDSNTGVSTLTTPWSPTLSSTDMNALVSYSNCPAGLPPDAVCDIKIKLITKTDSSAPSTCSAASLAQDCTKVFARGSFGSVNRALEIVYPNL